MPRRERTRFNRNEARTIPPLLLPPPCPAPSPEFQHYFGKPAAFLVVNELFLVRIICWTEFLPRTSFPPSRPILPPPPPSFPIPPPTSSQSIARAIALDLLYRSPIFCQFLHHAPLCVNSSEREGGSRKKRGGGGECNLRARSNSLSGEGGKESS